LSIFFSLEVSIHPALPLRRRLFAIEIQIPAGTPKFFSKSLARNAANEIEALFADVVAMQ